MDFLASTSFDFVIDLCKVWISFVALLLIIMFISSEEANLIIDLFGSKFEAYAV